MLSKAEDYLHRAEEAEAIARTQTDERQRSEWEKIARQWRDLAQRAEEQKMKW